MAKERKDFNEKRTQVMMSVSNRAIMRFAKGETLSDFDQAKKEFKTLWETKMNK